MLSWDYREFLGEIDRESVLSGMYRGLCDVWSTLKSATFVTDEQNTSSLGPPERPKKLVAVRIRSGSLRHTQPHMYPWSSALLDVYSFVCFIATQNQCGPI